MSKKALITGASRGIGRAIAIEFARAGYDLTLCCIKNIESLERLAKDLEDAYKVKCDAYQADVSDPQAVKELFSKIKPPTTCIIFLTELHSIIKEIQSQISLKFTFCHIFYLYRLEPFNSTFISL